jgi:hypothetical protein
VSSTPQATNAAAQGTVGSVLVLDFGKHIQLQENYYAPGSLGAFNFQIQVTFVNKTGAPIVAPVLNCAFMSSGVFATTNGQSAAYIGVLNKEEVLKAMEQEPTSQHTLERLVGGRKGPGLFQGLKTMAHRAFRFAKHNPEALGHLKQAIASAHPKAAHAVNALGMLGLGMDGGAKKHRLHHRVL